MKKTCDAKLLKGVLCSVCEGELDAVHRSEIITLRKRVEILEGALEKVIPGGLEITSESVTKTFRTAKYDDRAIIAREALKASRELGD